MIDADTKKTIKQIALDKDTTATEIYNKAIKQYIQRETSQTTFDE